MPRGFPSLTSDQKQEIIKRIKEKGERAPDLAKEYGITPKTIYNLLRKTAQGPHPERNPNFFPRKPGR